jgi:drug/metabolite transporter (DMT)-like permease
VTSIALALVLASAVLHAGWNAIAKAIRQQLVAFALVGIGGGCAAAVLAFAPAPARASWPLLATSALLHTGYNVLLLNSYRLGDFNQMYPLARGTSPWLVTLLAALLVGERLAAPQLAGLLLVTSGLALLVLAGGRPTRAQAPALSVAAATGVMIAAYTVVDGVGVRRSGSPLGYIAWLMLLFFPLVPGFVLLRRPGLLARQPPRVWLAGTGGGVLSLAAYALVLWAQTRGALAAIAALRETSIVVAAVIGSVCFHERFGRQRIAATVLVAGGIVLLNLG